MASTSSHQAPCPPATARVLANQYRIALAKPFEHLLVWADEADLRRWFFLVVGLEPPFAGGEFVFLLTAPDTFPQEPPKFEFLTPNGVFEPGGPICISIGEFHAHDAPGASGGQGWRPCLGMLGFAREVVNALVSTVGE